MEKKSHRPDEVLTRNKIRDRKIVKLWAAGNHNMQEIGLMFGISEPRVSQICYKNRHLLDIDKIHEKFKRINHLRYLLRKHPETMSKKSTLDIITELRKEIDGEKVDITANVNVTEMNDITYGSEKNRLEYNFERPNLSN